MRIFSLFPSRAFLTIICLLGAFLTVGAFEESVVECYKESSHIESDEIAQSDRFGFILDMPKGYLSGILILREDGEYTIGSIINECGMSAVDFRFDKKRNRIKLLNVSSFLNKWYIRKVLSKDLAYSLSLLKRKELIEKKGYEVTMTDNSIEVHNKRYNLKYSLVNYEDIE